MLHGGAGASAKALVARPDVASTVAPVRAAELPAHLQRKEQLVHVCVALHAMQRGLKEEQQRFAEAEQGAEAGEAAYAQAVSAATATASI